MGISRFVAPLDFANRDFRPLTLKAESPFPLGEGGVGVVTALGLQDKATGETILWLHDPASNWREDAKGVEPREWSGAKVAVPATRTMAIEIWDTRTGEVVLRTTIKPQNGVATVALPAFRRDVAVRLRGRTR